MVDALAGSLDRELVERASTFHCQACGTQGLVGFYAVQGIPTQTTVLLDTEGDAKRFPVGELLLGFCTQCALIQNVLFDQALIDYSVPTEESQAFSPLFSAYADDLADRLVDGLSLNGRSVLEVGCGKGDFLNLLSQRGIGRGVGIDPGFLPERLDGGGADLEFIRDYYGPRHLDLTGDLVVARHLMEHVPNTRQFLEWLGASVRATEAASLFIEVPDASRILEEGAFWDVYYEHCTYFTQDSLASALSLSNMEVDRVEPGFDDQYLLAWASPGQGQPLPADPLTVEADAERIAGFASKAGQRVEYWRSKIEDELEVGRPVAVWGASSKAVAFLAAVGSPPVIAVDINVHKQGKWLPGVVAEVRPPESLALLRPDLVIPMNPIYEKEIRADLIAMGLDSAVEPL